MVEKSQEIFRQAGGGSSAYGFRDRIGHATTTNSAESRHGFGEVKRVFLVYGNSAARWARRSAPTCTGRLNSAVMEWPVFFAMLHPGDPCTSCISSADAACRP